MAQISIKQLEAFVCVADLSSFRRAADKLNTTQPNISARMASLEAQIGHQLMTRNAGSVRLTPVGETLLLKARQVLLSMDDFVAAAGDDHLFDGILRLGVTEMIVHSWLGAFLAAFKARFPNIDVDLTVDVSTTLTRALFDRSIDLTLQSGPFTRATSGSMDLGQLPMVWVASPILGYGAKVLSLRRLAQHPFLTHAKGTLPFVQLTDHITAAPDVKVRLVSSSNLAACLQMTRDGLGVACMAEAMVRDDLKSGVLTQLRYLWVPDALSFHARYDAETCPHFVKQAALMAAEIAQTHLNPA